jgi:hypothetical protein
MTFLAFIHAGCSRKVPIAIVVAGLLINAAALASGSETPSIVIKVDQVGYPLDGPKVAFVSAPAQAAAATFEIKRASDRVSVLQGKLTPPQFDPNSGDQVQSADFTELKQAGTYYVDVPGVGRSFDFSVKRNVFDRTYYLAMRAFYGQRCGTAVDLGPEFPGYTHPACHLHGEFPLLGNSRNARQYWWLARCRRLWPLRGQFRDHHWDAALDLGDLRG